MTSTKVTISLTLAALCACRPAATATAATTTTTTVAPDHPAPRADLVIHAAHVFVGDGSVMEAMTVVVDEGTIVALEPSASSEWSGREEIDARAGTVLHELGRVEVGLRADLLVVEGDPTADFAAIEAVRVVVQGGEVVKRSGS